MNVPFPDGSACRTGALAAGDNRLAARLLWAGPQFRLLAGRTPASIGPNWRPWPASGSLWGRAVLRWVALLDCSSPLRPKKIADRRAGQSQSVFPTDTSCRVSRPERVSRMLPCRGIQANFAWQAASIESAFCPVGFMETRSRHSGTAAQTPRLMRVQRNRHRLAPSQSSGSQ